MGLCGGFSAEVRAKKMRQDGCAEFISDSLNFSVKYTRFHALCQPINQYEKHMRMDKNSLRVSHSLREFSEAITADLQMVPKAGVEPARCSHSGRF